MDSPHVPYKERSRDKAGWRNHITDRGTNGKAKVPRGDSSDESYSHGSLGVSQVPWAKGEGRDGPAIHRAGQGASGVAGGGCMRAECWSRAKPRLQPHRGEVREGRRELPAWMLCCINGLEMSRDSSARGDTEGTLAPAHIMTIVKEHQPQKRPFILALCSLLFISRKLPFVRLNLQEDFRIPGLLMPLPNTRQQYPESLNTLKANLYQIP